MRVAKSSSFARAAGQAVDLPGQIPGVFDGIPVFIDQAEAVSQFDLILQYDPSLLQIQGVRLADGLPNDWTIAIETSVAGQARITASGSPLAGGKQTAFLIDAIVPADAPYGTMSVLRLIDTSINQGAIVSRGAEALQLAANVGDATGNEEYSALDAAMIARSRSSK